MKKVLAAACAFLISALSFADGWYVCMGSFRNLDKANDRARILNESGFSVFVSEVEKSNSEKLYRVLFSQNFSNKKEAVAKRNELLEKNKIKSMKLNDLWCCESDGRRVGENPVSLNQRVVVTNQNQDEEPVPVRPEPVNQTIVVSVNGEEQQRFDINSDDRLIKINVKVDEGEPPSLDDAILSKSIENAEELNDRAELEEVPLQKSLDENKNENTESNAETAKTESEPAESSAEKTAAAEDSDVVSDPDAKTASDAEKSDGESAAADVTVDDIIEPAVDEEPGYTPVEDAK